MSTSYCARIASHSPRTVARMRRMSVALAVAVVGVTALSTARADQTKTNDSNPLNLGSSWVSTVAPGTADVAIFDGTITGAITPTLGANLSWGGIKVLNPGGAIAISGANSLTLGASGIDMSAATQNLSISSSLTLGATQTWNIASGRILTIGGNFNTSGAFNLLKTGTGSLVLSGANTIGGTTTFVDGTTVLTGSLTSPALATAASVITLTSAASTGPVTLLINGGTLTAQTSAGAGIGVGSVAGSVGAIKMTSGVLTTLNPGNAGGNANGQVNLGGNTGSYGAFDLSGGTVTLNRYMIVGLNNDRAAFNMTGGVLNQNVNALSVGSGATGGSISVANLSGGTVTATAGSPGGIIVGEFGYGMVNISNTAIVSVSGSGGGNNSEGMNIGKNAIATGVLNLLGGTLTTNRIWSQNTGSTSTLNFNGGQLVAGNSPLTGASGIAGFIGNTLDGAYVYAGGAKISDGGFGVTIEQPLLAPTGSGVTSIAYAGAGTGFASSPIINITGGGGTGATAVAVMDANGVMTGIQVTNPGVNYTSAPQVDVLINGNLNTAGSTATASIGANATTGGLTKTGSGTLVLSGANTYGGPTLVNAGRLRVDGSLSATSVVTINSGGTLEGIGTIPGAIIANSGGAIGPGDGAVGTLNATGGVTLNSGSILTVEFDGVSNDLLNVTGALTLNSGALVNLLNSGGTTAYSIPGTYTLINASSIAGAPANLSVLNAIAGFNYNFASTGTSITLAISGGSYWNNSAGGTWGDANNWTAGIPGGAGALAILGPNPTGLASDGVVTLDGNRTIGSLLFNNGSAAYTVASGTPGTSTLTLDNGTSSTSIQVAAGSHTISAPIALNSPLGIIVAAGSLTISGAVNANSQPISASGAGAFNILGNMSNFSSLSLGPITNVGNGGTTGGLSGGPITVGGTLTVNRSDAITIASNITNGTLIQAGTGTLTLPGVLSNNGLLVHTGKVNLSGTLTTGVQATVGDTSQVPAVLNITGVLSDTRTGNSSLRTGTAGSYSSVRLGGTGSMTLGGEFRLGNSNAGFSGYTQSGGTAAVTSFVVVGGNGDTSVFNQSGGTFTASGAQFTIAAGDSTSVAVVTVSGGTLNANAGTQGIYVGENGNAILNIMGTGFVSAPNSVQVGRNASSNGVINLNGGTLTTVRITKGASTGYINFNGGVFKMTTAATGTVLGNGTNSLTTAYVYAAGAIVDDSGRAVTIDQPLLAPTGSGVTSIALASGGSGYIDTPIVQLVGGSGTGATAVANLDYTTGTITGFTITNPGTGYENGAPNVSFLGGGGSGAAAGTINAAANVSGGFTKLGVGTLTLAGANTYAGPTNINAGSLLVSSDGNLGDPAIGAAVNLNGGTLRVAASLALDNGGVNKRNVVVGAAGGGFGVAGTASTLTVSGVISGAGALTVSGGGTVLATGATNYSGAATVTASTLEFGGGVSHAAGAIGGTGSVVVDAGTSLTSNAITASTLLINGNETLRANGTNVSTSVVSTLALGAAGNLQINNHVLVVNTASGTASKASVIASLNTLVAQGATGTAIGITSATVLADSLHKATYVVDNGLLGLATTVEGVPVNSSSVIVEATYRGDSNLDRKVNVTDLGVLATYYGQTVGAFGIVHGDFDGNGVVNVTDLGILATDYGLGTAPGSTFSLAADLAQFPTLAAAVSAVPEPASLAVLAVGAGALLTRRKRR